jgi:methylenetetrahydrofolate reductase (NADPH)
LSTSKPIAPAAEILRLLGDASIEVTARDKDAASVLGERLPQGARVHVTHLANDSCRAIVAQARALAANGFEPIPHIAARSLRSETELDDYLARMVGEAGATRVLLVAGDIDPPRGPFAASLDALKTGLLETRGIRGVSFAAHPEGHPSQPAHAMRQALADRSAYAAHHDLDAEIVTQFCFEAAPILDCIRDLRRSGIAAPVRIGAAAPTNTLRMMNFALRCGVGPSLRALEIHAGKFGEAMTSAGPERIVAELADALASANFGAVAGMHFFAFGGVRHSAEWLQQWRGSAAEAMR